MKILITGASKGIGFATAQKLLEQGHHIIGVSRTQTLKHPHFTHFPLDLSSIEKTKQSQKNLLEFSIDALILNAGKGDFKSLEEFSLSQIESLINLNYISPVFLTRLFLPLLKKRERADVIFINSVASLKGKKRGSIYCSTKAALRSFVQAVRDESASSSVRVSQILPGTTRTEFYTDLSFTPADHVFSALEAEDIANTICMILNAPQRAVFEEIVISPQKHAFTYLKNHKLVEK